MLYQYVVKLMCLTICSASIRLQVISSEKLELVLRRRADTLNILYETLYSFLNNFITLVKAIRIIE